MPAAITYSNYSLTVLKYKIQIKIKYFDCKKERKKESFEAFISNTI